VHIFKAKVRKKGFEKIAVIAENLIEQIDKFKKEINKKLHSGVADIETLNGIVIWSDINKLIGEQKTDDVLEDYTDLKIKEEIEGIENTIIETVTIIKEFLEEATTKLKENIE
jgi:hypothetical protein